MNIYTCMHAFLKHTLESGKQNVKNKLEPKQLCMVTQTNGK